MNPGLTVTCANGVAYFPAIELVAAVDRIAAECYSPLPPVSSTGEATRLFSAAMSELGAALARAAMEALDAE